MKTRLFFTLIAFYLLHASGFAQMGNGLFGNEWIQFGQNYYKIKVTEDGIHRIPYQHLVQSGVNISSANIGQVQLFHQGQEVPIYIHSTGNNVDYIEFYAEKNKGELDKYLYGKQHHHFNPEYSLVTDTAAYFLTFSSSSVPARYSDVTATLTNLPASEPYFMKRALVLPGSTWQPGKTYYFAGEAMSKSAYEYGEGWGTNKSASQVVSVPTQNLYIGGPSAQVEARIYSDGAYAHNLQIRVGNTLSYNSIFSGDSVQTHSFSVAQSQIGTPTMVTVNGANGASDVHSIAYIAINYPHTFNFEGQSTYTFTIPASAQRKYLEISNFSNPSNAQNVYLYDVTNKMRIHCYWDAASARVLTDLPAATEARTLVLICADNANAYTTVGRLESVVFTDYRNYNGDYVIIAHDNMFSDAQGQNPVLDYAAYRASTGYNPVALRAQEIFDQFGYGVSMHPQAMRNFCAYIMQNWSNPKHVFLVGKGRPYNEVRLNNTYDMLIPTFGTPPSDNLLFALGDDKIPQLAVGRLSVLDGDGLRVYLNKIKEMELVRANSTDPANRAWEKNVLHFSSGINESEQQMFSTLLNSMKDTLQMGNYGANVHSFFKKQTAQSDEGSSGRMDSLINNGVSIMTYLGHATTASFDYNAYLVENYQNRGRYPLFLSLSCSNGGIFSSNEEMSERFVLAPTSGAIAYIGFSQPISLSSANVFCNGFYSLLSNEGFDWSAAELLRKSLDKMQAPAQYNFLIELAMNYAIYHGDPAFKLNNNSGTDYTVNTHSITTTPALVTAQTESFDLSFDINNLGKVQSGSFLVSLFRKYPNGDSALVYSERVEAPANVLTHKIPVAVGGVYGAGVNQFTLKIDVDNEMLEGPNAIAEQNNQVVNFPVQIAASQVKAIYPPNFAMLPDRNFSLLASPADIFAPESNYIFELDTTAHFNSPLYQTNTVNSVGGLVSWTPNVSYMDSVVYYWRVSPANAPFQVENTAEIFSFMYKDGESGWNQSHVFQFVSNTFETMNVDTADYAFEYNSTTQEVSVINAFTPTVLAPGYVASFFNNVMTDKCRCPNERGVYVQVVDPNNFSIWTLPAGSQAFGAINCDGAGRPSFAYLFKTAIPAKQVALENFLRDSIPSGYYVMVYTLNNADAANWSNSLLSLFESYGSTKVRDLAAAPAGLPWAFFFQKGVNNYPHTAETLAATQNDIISLSGRMTDKWYKGKVESPLIGPMQGWDFVEWVKSTTNNAPTALNELEVYAVNAAGNSTRVIDHFRNFDTTVAMVDAMEYPYMKLVWNNADSINKVASQLEYWRVSGDVPGELLFRPELYVKGYGASVTKKDTLRFGIMIQNASTKNMDSVLIKYQLQGRPAEYRRVAPLDGQDTMRLPDYIVPASGMSGLQTLLIEINPNRDQPEATLSNNTALIPFSIREKVANPEIIAVKPSPSTTDMQVLYNGHAINNGDLLPSEVNIDATIRMTNPTQQLKELGDLVIKLKHPKMANGEMILDENNPLVQHLEFQAQRNGDNCNIKLNLALSLPWDEMYQFELGCKNSDTIGYAMNFRVEGEIAGILSNYPNPFSTNTNFSFTLSEEDTNIESVSIHISDMDGKLVRIINQSELGDLFLGMNKPNFSWNGTDQGGNLLASGIYFSTVVGKMKNGTSKSLTKMHKIVIAR